MNNQLKCPYCGNRTVKEINRNKQDAEYSDRYQCENCKKTFGWIKTEQEQSPYNQCHTVYFSYGGFPQGFKEIRIEGKDEYTEMKLTPPIGIDQDDELTVRTTLDEWRAIKAYLFHELFVLSWNEDYNDPDILDGTQWELTLSFDEREKFEVSGSNRFPVLFDKLLEYLNPYFEQVQAYEERIDKMKG